MENIQSLNEWPVLIKYLPEGMARKSIRIRCLKKEKKD